MAMLERLVKFLDENNIEYLHRAHASAERACEAAAAENVLPRYFAKTLVFRSDMGDGMAVVPADRRLDLKMLRQNLGARHVRLATESELEELFPDSEPGALPPFGNLIGLTVYMESTMAADAMIAFNAGTHRDAVHMRFHAFEALVKPVFMPLVHPETANA